jgi:integrase
VLDIEEIRAILAGIGPVAVKMMVAVAAASGLRRSEIRGLKWKDCDLILHWFSLKRGVVRKHETNLKTKASRKGLPMMVELAEALLEWRAATPYNQPEDWVFASPFTNGKRPYWMESALKNHVRPAALAANITKQIGWHTFRHSLATILDNSKQTEKTVQLLLRHASPRVTALYTHGDDDAKRLALTHASGIFEATTP